jgi:hypothetical protein
MNFQCSMSSNLFISLCHFCLVDYDASFFLSYEGFLYLKLNFQVSVKHRCMYLENAGKCGQILG